MSTESNKALVQRYQDAHNANNLPALDAIVAPDLISHNLLPGIPAGREGGKMVHQALLAAFPDQHTETAALIAEGDKVVQHFLVSGTNQGAFMGAPATGKSYKVPGMSIFRIANDKIVEHWGVFDQLGVLQQLGMIPMPG